MPQSGGRLSLFGERMHNDADIIRRVLAGEQQAYRSLVDRHAGAVRVFLLKRLRDPSAADDGAQEAFVRAYERLADLREPDRFLSWVLGIAANASAEQHRRERATRTLSSEHPQADAPREIDPALEGLVAALPEPYRETVRLRYWGGLSCEEEAAALGVPLGTLTKRLSRAHALLRESLEHATNTEERKGRHDELRAVP